MPAESTKTIGKDYTLRELGRFCIPAILNEFIFSLLYTLDDGLFISRFVGQNALAAFSILFPLVMITQAISSLLGGVSILVSRKLGERRDREANADFTAMILFVFAIGVILAVIENVFAKEIVYLLGATDILFPYAYDFLRISSLYIPLTLAYAVFVRFYIPAGKPRMELLSTILNVGSNFFFDWYFIVYRRAGMVGTAYANFLAVLIGNTIALVFFSRKTSEIHFAKPSHDILRLIRESSKYGISSFLSNASVAFGTFVSNIVILRYGTELYLAAYSIVNNIAFTFMGAFFGLFSTTGPLVSYAVGERNKEKLNRLFKQTFILITILAFVTILMFLILGDPVARLFTNESAKDAKDLINYGMRIMPYSFLFFGYNVGARMTFASLGNHRTSAFLTTMQEVVLNNITVIILPLMFGITGIWFSFLACNILMCLITVFIVYRNKDNYGYGKFGVAYLIDR